MSGEARSLDRTEAGETITVRRILFDTLRSHCSEWGVREGAWLRVRAGDTERMQLETVAGRAIPCERRYARFIQVESAGAQASAATATGGDGGHDGAGA